ncbi:MAG: two-component system response regulator [Alkalinema sp. CACIAM 70d]|nr:MAG: two-component system response regulator [Alkalinema sp. CACIAM 70d]
MTIKRVLIIDDEESIRNVVQFGLPLVADWDVLVASSGMEGILTAQTEQPDVILLDVMMPKMDGVTTFRALQQHPKTQSIPVIFLTAMATPIDYTPLNPLGGQGVITKPFNALELADQITKLLNW